MHRLFLLLFLVQVKLIAQQPATLPWHGQQPNIILLFCDDLGYGDLGCYGNPVISTPNLDKLAAGGLKFTSFYACSPACTASRYALLTGKYPVRSGFSWVLGPTSSKGIHPREVTLAEALRNAGYATACYGKWHLGTKKIQYLPLQNGFDDYYGLPYSNDMIPPKWGNIALMDGNDTIGLDPDQSLLTEAYTDRAIRFIGDNRQKPFFIYIPFSMVHVPLHPGKKFAGRSKRGAYGDVLEEIDYSTGRIIEYLETQGLLDNTLILFTSDNGPWLTQHQDAGSAGPLRDGKGSTWEGGLRVPGIAYWRNTIAPGQVFAQTASTLDLYRSFCTLAGAGYAEHQPDGEDLSGLLLGQKTDFGQDERLFFYYGPGNRLQAVRKGSWKLHLITNSQLNLDYFDKKPPLLFNLDQDPGEWYELSDTFPQIVDQLLGDLEKHQKAVGKSPGFFDQERNAARFYHKAFGKTVNFQTPPHPQYNNPLALTDGWKETPEEFNHLAGFRSDSMQCTLDLDSLQRIQKIEIGFLQETQSWIFLPKTIRLDYSSDGREWKTLATQRHAVSLKETSLRHAYIWFPDGEMRARYLRITATSAGPCPDWHTGAGKPSWLFADEIIVE